jgi:hypothetical protein
MNENKKKPLSFFSVLGVISPKAFTFKQFQLNRSVAQFSKCARTRKIHTKFARFSTRALASKHRKKKTIPYGRRRCRCNRCAAGNLCWLPPPSKTTILLFCFAFLYCCNNFFFVHVQGSYFFLPLVLT